MFYDLSPANFGHPGGNMVDESDRAHGAHLVESRASASRTARITAWLAAVVTGLPLAAILALILYFVAWFHSGVLYSGEGTYRRNAGEATFQVEFPPIDLTRPARYSFQFRQLAPSMNYVVGLRVLGPAGSPVRLDEYGRSDLASEERPNAMVSMQLQNEHGKTVFRHSRSLPEWNWMRNMAQITGETAEVPIGGGSVRVERLGVGPDGGWGTHFTPRFSGTYTLTIVVDERSTSAGNLRVYPVIEAYTAFP